MPTPPDARLDALERRVRHLERLLEMPDHLGTSETRDSGGTREAATEIEPPASGTYALLDTLERTTPDAAAIVGSISTDDGPIQWQYTLGRAALSDADWSNRAEALAALGNPARLGILQALVPGQRRVSDLVDELGFDSLGQLNHHVRVLTAAGWVESSGRGLIRLPPTRVVPLLAVIVATA